MASDDIWPLHTPVRHKKEGYTGWIHATTTMKEVFTGDLSVKWQYTIRVQGSEQLKVAGADDLEWIESQASFPNYVMYKESISDKNYLQETRLHALGYQISDLNSQERWNILKFVAIPMLGAKEVVRTVMAVISSRIARPANADKFRHAIRAWNKDLNAIVLHCKGTEDEASIYSSVSYIQRKLLDAKMIDKKDLV
ncbi:MAG: hypothetical protein HQL14_05850 [Candidatus Omnitrophica bacterium]|nr:hypothetical protein [Candidatus Omnitrophota bacterium]